MQGKRMAEDEEIEVAAQVSSVRKAVLYSSAYCRSQHTTICFGGGREQGFVDCMLLKYYFIKCCDSGFSRVRTEL